MKEITIALNEGLLLHTHGELVLDTDEKQLLVYGEDGQYMGFYWPNVLYYVVSNPTEEGESEND